MTPKEKAEELVQKYWGVIGGMWEGYAKHSVQREKAKHCAIIAIDEKLDTADCIWADVALLEARSCQSTIRHKDFLQQVKEEIKKL